MKTLLHHGIYLVPSLLLYNYHKVYRRIFHFECFHIFCFILKIGQYDSYVIIPFFGVIE